jgi:glycosyltransferase involved in cell wall biosynthesis
MRILFVTPNFLPFVGGLELLSAQLLDELQRRGHEVALLTSTKGVEAASLEDWHGTPVLRSDVQWALARRDGPGFWAARRQAARFVEEFDPDVAHAHDGGALLWVYNHLLRVGVRPLVMTMHIPPTDHLPGSSLDALAKLIGDAACVTAVSETVATDVRRLVPSVADRLSIIRNAIAPPAAEARPVDNGPARFLCLGRLVTRKGFDTAIEAFSLLDEPDARMEIAGDGPIRGDLARRAAALGVDDRIDMTGFVDPTQVPARMAAATAVVIPSHYEGLPLVALEAAWMARPVIASRAPGIAEAVVDGQTGLLVDADDPAALATKMQQLLRDRSLARRLGAAARSAVERDWSFITCVDRYEDAYRRALQLPAASAPSGAGGSGSPAPIS